MNKLDNLMVQTIKIILVATMLTAAGLTFSSAANLDGSEVKNLVEGKRVFLKIPFGGEFPLRYKTNGTVQGDGTGTGLGRFFSPKDEGVWWIKEGQLCQKWQEWYQGETKCFLISDVEGKDFRWLRDDGRKGKGRIE